MTTDSITFAQFSKVLRELGFVQRTVDLDGPRIVFHHAPTDTIVTVNPMRPNDRVPVRHVISARFVLPARGVTTEEHLDALLNGAATASRA